MLRLGMVIQMDPKNNWGVIRDTQGNDFYFTQTEVRDEEELCIGARVSFYQDYDYKYTRVAQLIQRVGYRVA